MTTPTKSVPVGKTPGQAPPTAKPTVHKVPIKMEIVEPPPKSELFIDNGNATTLEPTMPKLKLKATVTIQGQAASVGTVLWEFHLTGTYRHRSGDGPVDRPYSLPAGSVRTAPGEEKEFTLAPQLVVGGSLAVKATYTGTADVGGASVTATVAGCKVSGQHLDPNEAAKYIVARTGELAWVFLRVFAFETQKDPLQQFHNGIPWIGAPAGVGTAQRDVEPEKWAKVLKTEGKTTTLPNKYFPSIYWNWKRCVDEGYSFFKSEKLTLAQSDLQGLQDHHPKLPSPPEGVLYRAAIRRYNGGHEYDTDGTHYQTPNDPGEYSYKVVRWTNVPEAASHPVPAEALAEIWPTPAPPKAPAKGSAATPAKH